MVSNPSRFTLSFARQPVARLVGSAAVAAVLVFTPQGAKAAPVGGSVEAGTATFSSQGANNTTVTQSTERAIIAWDSFNLSANESVDFIVPNAQGATLNRINDSRPSTISGTITSNGAVYFTNPNGLIFDATSRVTANGFFAATQTIGNSVFLNNGVTRTSLTNLGTATISVNGAITAPAITVMAHTVKMNGSMESPRGDILVSSTHWTSLGAGAVISADAAQNGDGGKVIIWSDNHTDFLGNISARGGSTSGDGGFVEVSGKQTLNYDGRVVTLAPHGKAGTLLLDPNDLGIGVSGDGTSFGIANIPTITTIDHANRRSSITVAVLQTELTNGNVSLATNTTTNGTGTGKITFASAFSSTSTHSLTLISVAGIEQAAGATITLAGPLIMTANGTITLTEANNSISILGEVKAKGAITITNNVDLTLTGNIYSNWNSGTNSDGGGTSNNIQINTSSHKLTLGANVTTSGGAVNLNLGSAALDVSSNHYYIATSSTNNLSFRAGSISNKDTTSPIFKLGGNLVIDLSSTVKDLVIKTIADDPATTYDVNANYTGVSASNLATIKTNLNTISTYSFADSNTGTISSTILNLPTTALAANGRVIGRENSSPVYGVKTAGFKGSTGDITWAEPTATTYSVHNDITLPQGKAMVIAGVTNSAATNVTNFAPTTISFSGTNSFIDNLTLTATSTISQTGGTITMAAGKNLTLNASGTITQSGGTITVSGTLAMTATGGISLNQLGNSLGTIGAVTNNSSGGVTIWNNGALTLNGNITATGAIEINTTKNSTSNANGDLTLNSNISASGTDLRISLGSSGKVLGSKSLTANGMKVYFTAANTGNASTIAVGTGQFLYYSEVAASGSVKDLKNQTIPLIGFTDNGDHTSYDGGGLTVTAAATALVGNGIKFNDAVTIDGIDGTMDARNLNYLESSGAITVSGTGSSFTGSLQLVAGTNISQSAGGAITMAANSVLSLKTSNGSISLNQTGNDLKTLGTISAGGTGSTVTIWNAAALSLSGNITADGAIGISTAEVASGNNLTITKNITTSGGAVTLNLGGGTYNYGSFWFDTSNKDLTLKAGDIANRVGTIFKLGSTGQLRYVDATGVQDRVLRNDAATKYTVTNNDLSGADLSAIDAASGTITTYSFKDGNSGTITDGNKTLNLPTSLLAAAALPTLGTKEYNPSQGVETAGLLKDGSGNVTWEAVKLTRYNSSTNISLTTGKAMAIAGVSNSTATSVNTFAPTTISFSGTNSFTGSLYLTAKGSITQSGGTLDVSQGQLNLTAVGGISLNQDGNRLSALGEIYNSGSGAITISTSTAVGLIGSIFSAQNGDINSVGTITIRTNGNDLTLSKDLSVRGGALILNLGSGAIKGGKKLTLTNQDIYFTGATSGNSATIDVGSASFVFVKDRSTVTGITLNGSSTANHATNGWSGSGFSDWTAVAGGFKTNAGGITVLGLGAISRVQGLGVRYNGTVTLAGFAKTDAAGQLRYIEGAGIDVTGASAFAASVTLVSSGGGNSSGVGFNIQNSLTAGTTNDGISNLNLVQTGTVASHGILFGASAANITLTAGGELSLLQNGFVNGNGIQFAASNSQTVTLVSGTYGFVWVKTNGINLNLNLATGSSLTVSGGKNLRIDLGASGKITHDSTIDTITASNYNVFFTGATTGNDARLDLSGGSFVFVKDLSNLWGFQFLDGTTSANNQYLPWSTGIAAGLGSTNTSWATVSGGFSAGGITVLTTGTDISVKGLGFRIGGGIAIDGFRSAIDTGKIRYIEASALSVNGNAASSSIFAGEVTLVSYDVIYLKGTLTTGGAVTIRTFGDLIMTDHLSSSGGDVTVNTSANYSPFYDGQYRSWNLNGQKLTLNAGGWGGGKPSNDIELFRNLNAAAGSFVNNTGLTPGVAVTTDFATGVRTYFTSFTLGSDEFNNAAEELKLTDSTAVLRNISDMTKSAKGTYGFKLIDSAELDHNLNSVYWYAPASRTVLPPQIGFIGVKAVGTLLTVTPTFSANTDLVIFGKNSFTQDFSTYSNITRLSFADDSVTSGTIKLATTTDLAVGSGVSLPSFGGAIKITSTNGNAVNVRLINSGNAITSISGNTNGGSVTVVTNSTAGIKLEGLNTGGGSVSVVNTGGGISTTGTVVTGGFSFRAAGAVSLSGSFASTEGYGSSVNINNSSASWVAGNIVGDAGVNLGGSGSVVLTGSVSSSGAVDVNAPATVVNNAVINTGGAVTIAQQVNAINTATLHSLLVNAGVINLGANIGSVTRLGWVEFNAASLTNSKGYNITYSGGTAVPTNRQIWGR